ncbi:MAG: aldo/keto reductase, partial [Dehalococcoidia bacterium]
ITGCESMKILQQAIDLARNFTPMTEEERSSLLARTFELGKDGKEEGFKTTDVFDGTTRNPDWLG